MEKIEELRKMFKSLDGKVTRFTMMTGWCEGPILTKRNFGILDYKNNQILKYLKSDRDLIFGMERIHYFPSIDLELGDADSIYSHKYGVLSAEDLKCSPEEYEEWLTLVFEKYSIEPDFDKEHYIDLTQVREEKGRRIIEIDLTKDAELPVLKGIEL